MNYQTYRDQFSEMYPVEKRILPKIRKYAKETGRDFETLISKEEFTAFFESIRFSTVRQFDQIKVYCKKYMLFLIERGIMPKEAESSFVQVLFEDCTKNLEKSHDLFMSIADLRQAVERTLQDMPYDNAEVYDTQVLAIYLTWYEVPLQKICDIRKEDVTENGVLIDGQELSVACFVRRILQRYRDADCTATRRTSMRQMQRNYKPGEYLFRTAQSAHMEPSEIQVLLTAFSKHNPDGRSFSCKKVRLSGVFNRAIAEEDRRKLSGEPIDFSSMREMSELFHENFKFIQHAQNRTRDYRLYKRQAGFPD